MSGKAFLFDATLCTGCESCRTACKAWNGLPPAGAIEMNGAHGAVLSDAHWCVIRETSRNYVQDRCRHCADPQCRKACPADAIHVHNGFVLIDHDRCIGCGGCVRACPYTAVFLAKGSGVRPDGKAHKCHGCVPEPDAVPHCALNCPSGALVYGVRRRLVEEGRRRLASLRKRYPDAVLIGIAEDRGHAFLSILTDPGQLRKRNASADRDTVFIYRSVARFVPDFAPVRRSLVGLIRIIAGRS